MAQSLKPVRIAPKGMGLADFVDRQWDFSTFGRGERFVYEKLPDGEFDEIMAQVTRWGLDNYLKERRFEQLAVSSR